LLDDSPLRLGLIADFKLIIDLTGLLSFAVVDNGNSAVKVLSCIPGSTSMQLAMLLQASQEHDTGHLLVAEQLSSARVLMMPDVLHLC
jgi:hypothetical protein